MSELLVNKWTEEYSSIMSISPALPIYRMRSFIGKLNNQPASIKCQLVDLYTKIGNDLWELSVSFTNYDLESFMSQVIEYNKKMNERTNGNDHIETEFDSWIVKELGMQDASIYCKGTQVRNVAISYAKYSLKHLLKNS